MFRFTPRQIEVFLAVTRVQSFRKAAEALRITPASVSEQVRQLEDQLGARLFQRHPGRGLEMSREGNQFLRAATDFVASGVALGKMFSDARSAEVRTFIGVSLMEYFVSPKLPDFLRENGDIAFKFLPNEVGFHLDEEIARQELDCAIVYQDIRHPMGEFVPLATDEAFIFVNRRLAERRLEIDLNSLPFVTCNAPPSSTEVTVKLLQEVGIQDPVVFAEVGHQGMAVQLVTAFDCGMVIFPFAARILDAKNELVPIKKIGDWQRRLYVSPRLGEDVRDRLTKFFEGIFADLAPHGGMTISPDTP